MTASDTPGLNEDTDATSASFFFFSATAYLTKRLGFQPHFDASDTRGGNFAAGSSRRRNRPRANPVGGLGAGVTGIAEARCDVPRELRQ